MRDQTPFVLNDWTVDPSTGELRRGDEIIRLEPRVAEVLVHLARARGRLVSKRELFETVWGGAAVSDDVLRRCIHALRRTLGDDPLEPRYIRTLPRRGYQLVAEVSPRPPEAGAGRSRSRRQYAAAGAFLFLVVVAAAAAAWLLRDSGTRVSRQRSGGAFVLARELPPAATAEELFDLAAGYAARHDREGLERAIDLFSRGLALDPEQARAHAELANAYALSVAGYFRNVHRLDRAIDHANLALRLDPSLAQAHKALGVAFDAKGWLAGAAHEYERALELQPRYQAVINNLALVQVSRGRLAEALRLQRMLDGSGVGGAVRLNNLGYVYRLLGDYPSARRFLDASLELMPDYDRPTANLAFIELAEGHAQSARQRMRLALPRYPGNARFMANAALIELAAGDLGRAEALFRESAALSAEGTNGRAWLGLAYTLLQRGEDDAAEQIGAGFEAYDDESRRLRREHWASAYNLAAIHAISGRIDEAVAELRRAVSYGYVDYRLLAVTPFFEHLHGDARYEAILAGLRRSVDEMSRKAASAGIP